MRYGIFGKKVGMTLLFDEGGGTVPVTVIDTSDCFITQVKTVASDGYNALQVGAAARKPQNVNKASQGHHKKAGVSARAWHREIRLEKDDDLTQLKAGDRISPTVFQKGDLVDVIGVSKGRGFTGVMKRFGFKGKDATHGTSKYFRHGGSNGSNTCPGRVLKNKGMPGHHGDSKVTVPNVRVFDVKPEDNLLLIRGAVPGPRSGMVLIRSTKRAPSPQGRSWVAA